MRRLVGLTVLFSLLLVCAAGATANDEPVLRGEPLGDFPQVELSDLLAKPAQYMESPVIVEGFVQKACTTKGCWMEIATAPDAEGIRVTFKDYGFFVPTDLAKDTQVKMQGVIAINELSKEDADHLEGEGARLTRNEDGTAKEISFVATGVELDL